MLYKKTRRTTWFVAYILQISFRERIMPHRDGGKSRGTHTTCSDLSARVWDIAIKIQGVEGISLGVLESGKGVTGGSQKVKIGNMTGGILLTVRQSRSVQDIRIFSHDVQRARLALARALRDERIPIAFRH